MEHPSAYRRSNERASSAQRVSVWSELVEAMPIVIFARALCGAWRDLQRSHRAVGPDREQRVVANRKSLADI
jgi:hypothetical protein